MGFMPLARRAPTTSEKAMKLIDIARRIGAATDRLPDRDIERLLTDSRSLAFPAGTLFFALTSDRNDGHRYIAELYEQNVRNFVVGKMLPEYIRMPEAAFLLVDDPLQALQQLAASHRSDFHIPVVGITGSNGKTIVKEWIYQLLRDDLVITRSPRSYNSQTGVPLSVWAMDENTQLGVFEAGISKPGEMARLEPIIRPTIGIITHIGGAHQENFENIGRKIEEKLSLFTHSDVLIYNDDYSQLRRSLDGLSLGARLFSWSHKKEATLRVISVNKRTDNSVLSLCYEGRNFRLTLPFTDDASVENAIHCIAFMLCFGYDTDTIAARIARLEPVAMRLEVKEGIRGCVIINDSYNSDINSLDIALDFMNRQAASKRLTRTLILSDIAQGYLSPGVFHAKVASMVRNRQVTRFIGVGSELAGYASLFGDMETHFFPTTADLLRSPLMHSFHNELVLLKGSRDFRLEDVSARLESIAHETVLEVNLSALVDNLNHFRSKIHPDTKIVGMVKAFAYGSGAVEVARTLQDNRCDYLAVALADEGVELRRGGIRLPIMVMNPQRSSFDLILDYRLEPEIYSFHLLEAFVEAVRKQGLEHYPIHLKIDTGMHRLGFSPGEIGRLLTYLKSQRCVKIRSVFSHLAAADEALHDDFTRQQVNTFTACYRRITRAFGHKILRHVLATPGIERFPQYCFDMVRLGIGHYGISALPDTPLRQVCTLRTVILQIRTLPAGETVGYGRRGVLSRPSRIAVLPIGYADGYDRRLGNGQGQVSINGRRATVVGNVCMDLCMVDVTDIDAHEGDPVEIFGPNIPLQEIAGRTGTIPYEILTRVSRRVKRVYYKE